MAGSDRDIRYPTHICVYYLQGQTCDVDSPHYRDVTEELEEVENTCDTSKIKIKQPNVTGSLKRHLIKCLLGSSALK